MSATVPEAFLIIPEKTIQLIRNYLNSTNELEPWFHDKVYSDKAKLISLMSASQSRPIILKRSSDYGQAFERGHAILKGWRDDLVDAKMADRIQRWSKYVIDTPSFFANTLSTDFHGIVTDQEVLNWDDGGTTEFGMSILGDWSTDHLLEKLAKVTKLDYMNPEVTLYSRSAADAYSVSVAAMAVGN
jgi:hypothetical protein